MASYNNDQLIRNYADNQTNASFIDNILNADNIQIHKSTPNFVMGNSTSMCPPQNDTEGFQVAQYKNINETNSSPDIHTTTDATLEEFKNQVKIWIRLDNEVKELTTKMKVLDNERKQRKKYMASLTPIILEYMNANDIEELNSRYGRLKSNNSLVKIPQSMRLVKEKLYSKFEDNAEYLDSIFKNRERVEKVTLKRLKN